MNLIALPYNAIWRESDFSVKHGPHLGREYFQREWFLNKVQAGFEDAVIDNGVRGVARHKQDFGIGTVRGDLPGYVALLMPGRTTSVSSRWMGTS